MELLKRIPLLKRAIDIGYTVLLVVVLSAVIGLILAFPILLLWNFVFGELYKINVLQAWALVVLCGILIGRTPNDKK